MSLTMIPSTRTSKKRSYKPLAEGLYPARMVRFVGLGVQPQAAYQGQEKSPAFKVGVAWEIYDNISCQPIMATEIKDGVETVTDQPACLFQELYLFPNSERGKVFDLYKAFAPAATKSPADLDTFFDKLGHVAMVTVSQYNKKDGGIGNGIRGVSAALPMVANMMAPAQSELVQFNPYSDTHQDKINYAKVYGFQREILANAIDRQYIPLAGSEPIKLEEDTKEQEVPVLDETINPFI